MLKLIDGSNMLHRAVYDIENQKKYGVHPVRDIYLRFMTADHSTMVVWDGPHSNRRRREVYAGYKSNRPEKAEDIAATFDIVKRLLLFCPVIQIEIPYWEADDVLYTIAKQNAGQTMTIETNDTDFWQLANVETVSLPMVKPLPCLPEHTVTYKAMVGDPGDNIKGWIGFGPKKWEAVCHIADEITRCLREEDYNGWLHIPWPKGVIADYGTFFQCCTYYKIVQMQLVPEADFVSNVVVGQPRPALAEEILNEYKI